MRVTGNRIQSVALTAMILILGLYATGNAHAATCKDELDRFERRLHSSALEAKDPDTFHALARQAEEAAELRDEQQCLETVAALNDVVRENTGVQTSAGEDSRPSGPANDKSTDNGSSPSRPAAPVLMMAGDDDADDSDEEQKPATSGAADQDTLDD